MLTILSVVVEIYVTQTNSVLERQQEILIIVLIDLAKNGVSQTMFTTTTGVWAKTLMTLF